MPRLLPGLLLFTLALGVAGCGSDPEMGAPAPATAVPTGGTIGPRAAAAGPVTIHWVHADT